MPRITKPKLLWNNNLLARYQGYDPDSNNDAELWDQAKADIEHDLDLIINKTDKIVDGMIYLIGTMQIHGESRAVSRPLKTDNLSVAIKKATDLFKKDDNALQLYIAENELVLSSRGYQNLDTPSVFSFRCVATEDTDITDPDVLAEKSTSLAPLARRTCRAK